MVILITSGSGNGRSAYAEQIVLDQGVARRYYMTTTRSRDGECGRGTARRRQMRVDKGFGAIECYQGLSHVTVESKSMILLGCMSNLLTGEYYQGDASPPEAEMRTMTDIRHLQKQTETLIIVTNEMFQDGIEYDGRIRCYQQILGRINQKLVKLADEVTEVVLGISVTVKKRGETS